MVGRWRGRAKTKIHRCSLRATLIVIDRQEASAANVFEISAEKRQRVRHCAAVQRSIFHAEACT
jgi:hypothetical protein